MSKQKQKRTYNVFTYADAYFWARCPGLKREIVNAIGSEYVDTPTQMGNLLGRLNDLGYGKTLAKQLRQHIY